MVRNVLKLYLKQDKTTRKVANRRLRIRINFKEMMESLNTPKR
jgi:hypothetical protein